MTGNTVDGDYCARDCSEVLTVCGDGEVRAQKSATMGMLTPTTGRLSLTAMQTGGNAPHCGDGDITDSETCDAGDRNTENYTATPGCNTTCTGPNPHCGMARCRNRSSVMTVMPILRRTLRPRSVIVHVMA